MYDPNLSLLSAITTSSINPTLGPSQSDGASPPPSVGDASKQTFSPGSDDNTSQEEVQADPVSNPALHDEAQQRKHKELLEDPTFDNIKIALEMEKQALHEMLKVVWPPNVKEDFQRWAWRSKPFLEEAISTAVKKGVLTHEQKTQLEGSTINWNGEFTKFLEGMNKMREAIAEQIRSG
jgi:hypothetical protein